LNHIKVSTVSAFHEFNSLEIDFAMSKEFVLYHGNLGISENYNAAESLIINVFSKLKIKCIIAGNKAPTDLKQLISKYSNIELVENVSTQNILKLIKEARLNVLYTAQATGIKLKLLSALYCGKFCIVNTKMVEQTGLEKYCIVSNSFAQMIEDIETYYNKEFDAKEFEKRKEIEHSVFSTIKNAQLLLNKIFK
jgi:ribosomal protein L30E